MESVEKEEPTQKLLESFDDDLGPIGRLLELDESLGHELKHLKGVLSSLQSGIGNPILDGNESSVMLAELHELLRDNAKEVAESTPNSDPIPEDVLDEE